MGRECRVTRWFKGLFGIKRGSNSSSRGGERNLAAFICHDPATVPPNISPAEASWLISHSISAGKASVAVVRLNGHDGDAVFVGGAAGLAAVMIQTVFRGFLARKALRALKGLVKIQALVRGFLVRKQAAETLQSMEALMRAQATVRCRKIRARMSPEHFGSIRLNNASISDFGDDPLFRKVTSPLPILRPPRRAPAPDCRSFQETERFFSGDDCRFSTAQNTPRSNIPATPPRSVAGESLFRQHVDFPNYMTDTTSFRAKLRSYSAPKQRPEPKKETMESRSLRIRRSQVGEAISFKNAVMGKLDRSGSEYGIVRDIVRGSPGYVHNI